MTGQRSELYMPLGLTMGTLNVCVLMLGLVLSLYLSADLGEVLADLPPAIGLAVFGLLWAMTCFCTYKGWQEIDRGVNSRVGASAKWGAFNGVSFFLALLAVLLVVTFVVAVAEGNGDQAAGVIAFSIIAGGIGTILSAFVGLAFGVAFGAVDLVLLESAGRLSESRI
jgi:hypothetical protein